VSASRTRGRTRPRGRYDGRFRRRRHARRLAGKRLGIVGTVAVSSAATRRAQIGAVVLLSVLLMLPFVGLPVHARGRRIC
jgi:hypothetical protein